MKKILIVGSNSYIGTSFEKWIARFAGEYQVATVGTLYDEWKTVDFSHYDVLLHVAGIAHVSSSSKLKDLYNQVNRDLAIDVANKAMREGVKQFIFMSSIIIYGKDGQIGEKRVITNDTSYEPDNAYGRSKLEADLAIQKLRGEGFKPVIIRTPTVYGPGCKGNFPQLIKLAKKAPVFPNIENERSMIFIDNLCEFIRKSIDYEVGGVFYPQNKEYVSTTGIIRECSKVLNRKILFTKVLNGFIQLASKKVNPINKVFGNKVYDQVLNPWFEYNVVSFKESIKMSVVV